MGERELFIQALQISDLAERKAFLQSKSGADEAQRLRLEELLDAHLRAADYLEAPPAGRAVEATLEQHSLDRPDLDRLGAQVGPYKLLQRIGEGGMGVVYMAEQSHPVKRRVALKVIKPGMDSGQVIARFEAERQALAMMEHPNIAKVLDAGSTASGLPYFVMELVNGVPITKYCDDQRLTTRERLELFIPVCQAVQHAHQKGVIHRDLKPSNVLVALYDASPVPKVIDFGVAKAMSHSLTEKTMFTQLGQTIGTLEYMSPEQAQRNQLDIDTRSDIYTLGVLLYELLTGDTPFDRHRLRSAAFDELLRIIRDEEPPRPSTRLAASRTLPAAAANRNVEPKRLDAILRGELDWIVMKALEKQRSRRYETAAALAQDIQNHLNDERVVACPPSAGYRLHKFARRNRIALATGCAVLLALLLGVIATTWQAVRATEQSHRALAAERLADRRFQAERRSRAAAEATRRKEMAARQEAESARREAEIARQAEARERLAAEKAARIAQAVSDFLQVDLLTQSDVRDPVEAGREVDSELPVRVLLDRAIASLGERFRDQPVVEAAVRRTIGNSYSALGIYDQAESQLETAWTLQRTHLPKDDPDTLLTACDVADLYEKQGRWYEAADILEKTLATQSRQLGEEHRDTLATMAELGHAWSRIADRGNEAETLCRRSLEIRQRVFGKEDDFTLLGLHTLALVNQVLGRLDRAEALYEECLDIRRRKLGSTHPSTIITQSNLAAVYSVKGGRHEQAIANADKALASASEAYRSESVKLTYYVMGLGETYLRAGDRVKATPFLEEALRRYRQQLGPEHPRTRMAQRFLCEAFVPTLQRCLWLVFEDPGAAVADAEKIAESLSDDPLPWKVLGMVRYWAGDLTGAEEALRKLESLFPDELAEGAFFLAMAIHQRGDIDLAKRYFSAGLAWTMERERPPEQLHFLEEAERLLGLPSSKRESLAWDYVNAQIGARADSAALYRQRAAMLRSRGESERAGEDLAQAVALDPSDKSSWVQMVEIYCLLGKFDQAVMKITRAREAMAANKPRFGNVYANTDVYAPTGLDLRLVDLYWFARWQVRTQERAAADDEMLQREAIVAHPEILHLHVAGAMLASDNRSFELFETELLKRSTARGDLRSLYLLTRARALRPVTPNTGELVSAAERLIDQEATPWHLNTLGLCLLRAGRQQAAKEEFERSLTKEWSGKGLNWLGLSLCEHHRGRADEARAFLREALHWCDTMRVKQFDCTLHPHDRIAALLLLSEAEALIELIDNSAG